MIVNSVNYICPFFRFLDLPNPLVALSTHVDDPPLPPLAYIYPKLETPPFLHRFIMLMHTL